MLRITVEPHADSIVLKVAGSLRDRWVAELERCWRSTWVTGGKHLLIELSDVAFVDGQGQVLLREMWHNGAELVAKTPLMKAVIEDIATLEASHCAQ